MLGDSLKPNIAQYGELKYVMRCVNESMRLYPHPPVLLRRALVPDVLPGGYEVRSSARSPQLLLLIVACRWMCLPKASGHVILALAFPSPKAYVFTVVSTSNVSGCPAVSCDACKQRVAGAGWENVRGGG